VILQSCTMDVGPLQGTPVWVTYLTPTATQYWTAADGSGSELTAPQGPGHFQTPAQKAQWTASGQSNECAQPVRTETIPPSSPQKPRRLLTAERSCDPWCAHRCGEGERPGSSFTKLHKVPLPE
jgi:hypothetical protein